MTSDPLRRPSPQEPADYRWRHRFSAVTMAFTVLLIGMGGFVTSINAGLAVPDWPTSFGSMDPFRPMPEWWTVTPVLAEHGHRLLGALIGILTTVLTVWTWRSDHRLWMRRLGVFALALVVVQGILGGLRVVWISLDMAVVHACAAQLFFAILLFLTIATSKTWLRGRYTLAEHVKGGNRKAGKVRRNLRRLSVITAAAVFCQIILGALLRHPGEGIDTALAYAHIGTAVVVLLMIVGLGRTIRRWFPQNRLLQGHRGLLYALLAVQVGLGMIAYVVLLNETGRLVEPSIVQVTVNTSHVVVGALLFGTSVSLALWALRRPIQHTLPDTAGSTAPDASRSPSTQTA